MRFLSLLIGLLLFQIAGHSQSIENVDFTLNDDYIRVTYNLTNCPETMRYDVELSFMKSNGEIIRAYNVKGEVKNVVPGSFKQIQWFYKNEIEDYEGDLKAIVKVVNSYPYVEKPVIVEKPVVIEQKPVVVATQSTTAPPVVDNSNETSTAAKSNESTSNANTENKNYSNNINATKEYTRGPSNALISVLLPGFGGFAVNKTDKFTPLLIAAMFWGSAYYSYDAYKQSTDNYNLYLTDKTQADMDLHFKQATQFKQTHETFLAAAAGVWLFDVIHVIVKGAKNVREQKEGLTKNLRLVPTYKTNSAATPFQLSIVKTF